MNPATLCPLVYLRCVICAFGGMSILSMPAISLAATLDTLVSFNLDNGAYPDGTLLAGPNGSFYGTTTYGGNGAGTVYQFDVNTTTLTTLATFDQTTLNGVFVGLVSDLNGNLYGTSIYGGTRDRGAIFRITVGTNTITTLASFDGNNGTFPNGDLVIDSYGNLYGTTGGGGANNRGTVFQLTAGSNSITTIASFNGTNGGQPRSGLVSDAAGNLYGTTLYGGSSDRGTIFRINIETGILSTIFSFNGTNGAYPEASFIKDEFGNFYGTTRQGGPSNLGTIFRFDSSTDSLTSLAAFDGSNGAIPAARLIQDAAGNLFGTTTYGGEQYSDLGGFVNPQGTVFRLEADTNTITTLISFNGLNGAMPASNLFVDSVGNLYGTAGDKGPDGWGTIFRVSNAGFIIPEPATGILWIAATLCIVNVRRKWHFSRKSCLMMFLPN